ncbi:hypothetical protein FQZ97_488620 [compost metagenome]
MRAPCSTTTLSGVPSVAPTAARNTSGADSTAPWRSTTLPPPSPVWMTLPLCP